MTGPDFAEQARRAYECETGILTDDVSWQTDRTKPPTGTFIIINSADPKPPDPPNKSLFWATAAIVAVALALMLGFSLPCDHEFWGGIKVGLGAVCP